MAALTVAENVAYGLKMRHVPRAERDGKVGARCSRCGSTPSVDRYPA